MLIAIARPTAPVVWRFEESHPRMGGMLFFCKPGKGKGKGKRSLPGECSRNSYD